MNLLELLFESSSLRDDLKDNIKNVLVDLLNSIELTDELLARVNDETYDFIKRWKNK